MLAARVLSDHFDQVTLIDRDHFPAGPEVRKGVPQANHLHVLLVKGRQLLDQLFPGLDADLLAGGVMPLEWGHDSISLTTAGWTARFHSGLVSYAVGRPYLDWVVRRRVAALPNVRLVEGSDVTGLIASADVTRITGVRVRARRGADSESVMDADLVVDASGRSSRTPEWLKALGYEAPQETVINSFVGYASRMFEPPEHFVGDWNMMFIFPIPPVLPRGGSITQLENGQWIVTIAGAARDYPPTDEDGFMAFARSLATPLLYETIKDAKPSSPIHGYRQMANQWRHLERLVRWPDSLVVIGDAACAFNPIYGQGMTVAALEVLLLDACLREQRQRHGDDLAGMAQPFQRQLARSNATPWLLATSEDMRYPTTVGSQPGLMTRLMHRYMDRVIEILPEHIEAQRTFLKVLHLIEPPGALFRPHVLGPVVRNAFRRPRPKELVVRTPYPLRTS